jgi:hypothetical protein
MPSPFLSIYLNDHFAGSVVGLELARRARDSNPDGELGRALTEVCAEIEADRETLTELMDRLGVGRSPVKPAGAWVGEKLGRLKLNGRLRGYSPLSRVVELEGLCTGIAGKQMLWRSLERSLDTVPGFDFEALAERAAAQRERLEAHRLEAASTAFAVLREEKVR